MCSVSDGAALNGVLEAAGYAGRSLARIGLDFWPDLEPAITSAVRTMVHRGFAMAAAMFHSAINAHKWVAMPVAEQQLASAAGAAKDTATQAGLQESAKALMCHPPLAVLVNGVRICTQSPSKKHVSST